MQREEFENQWNNVRGKLQEKWAKINHEDLQKINGEYDQLLSCLQRHYGYSRDQANQEATHWLNTIQMHSKPQHAKPAVHGKTPHSAQHPTQHSAHPTQHPTTSQGFWNAEESEKYSSAEEQPKHKKRKAG